MGRIMSDHEAKQATPAEELERQIISANVPKNEREWWASHEIERLRASLSTLESRLQEVGKKLADERAGRARIIEGFEFRERDLEHRLQEAERRAEKAEAEVRRLNEWADGFSDRQLEERRTGEEYQRELYRAKVSAERQLSEVRAENERLRQVLADANNKWRHEFATAVEQAADKLFARLSWQHTVKQNPAMAEKVK